MSDTEKIYKEIERRMLEDYNAGEEYDEIAQGVCASLLAFIDSLEQEPQGLDKSSKKHIEDVAEDHSEAYDRIYREMDERQRWREEHPEEYAKLLDDAVREYERLDEAANSYRLEKDNGELYGYDLLDAFKAGAKWRDSQILKLPDNLDRAAERYGLDEASVVRGTLSELTDAFKAGAKWMAEQGVSYEDVVYLLDGGDTLKAYPGLDGANETVCLCNAIEDGCLKVGDKVIVQIRKKEE